MQQQQEQQVKSLTEQLTVLKVRCFDANEQIGQMTQFQNEFFGHLGQMLGIDAEQAKDPNAYLRVVGELVRFHNENFTPVAPEVEEVEAEEV